MYSVVLIIEETGQGDDSSVVGLVLASIKAVKKFADWSGKPEHKTSGETTPNLPIPLPSNSTNENRDLPSNSTGVGLNLSYTINLNLPATSDIAVFNAIFKS